MKRFFFSLEKVLKHREQLKKIAEKEYREAEYFWWQETEKLEGLKQDIVKTREYNFSQQNDKHGVYAAGLIGGNEFITGTLIRIEAQELKVREAREKVEKKFELLEKAATEYRMIEKLKEKRKLEYLDLLKKEEEKFIDEVVTSRFDHES